MAESALGQAASGQVWEDSGNWVIEDTDQPYALFGNAIILPFYYLENAAGSGGSHVGIPSASIMKWGETAQDADPLTLMVDRPTQFIGTAFANVTNDTNGGSGGNDCNVQFFLIYEVNGVDSAGRQTNTYTGANDNQMTPMAQKLCATAHATFVNGSPEAPATVECWWGFRHDTSGTRAHFIKNMKMTIMTSYAPDHNFELDGGGQPKYTTKKRPIWTPFGFNRRAYRRLTGND